MYTTCVSRRATPIIVSPEERATLDMWGHGKRFPLRLVQRAQIILMASDGVLNQDIAETLGTTRPTIQLWRDRFLAFRLPGLEKDALDPAACQRLQRRKLLRWSKRHSIRSLSMRLIGVRAAWRRLRGLVRRAVRRIWKQHNLKPHLIKSFTTPCFGMSSSLRNCIDVVGLYMNPPDKALVLCVDEKSQIQALGRNNTNRNCP